MVCSGRKKYQGLRVLPIRGGDPTLPLIFSQSGTHFLHFLLWSRSWTGQVSGPENESNSFVLHGLFYFFNLPVDVMFAAEQHAWVLTFCLLRCFTVRSSSAAVRCKQLIQTLRQRVRSVYPCCYHASKLKPILISMSLKVF